MDGWIRQSGFAACLAAAAPLLPPGGGPALIPLRGAVRRGAELCGGARRGEAGALGQRCACVALVPLPTAGGIVPALCWGRGGEDGFLSLAPPGGVKARPLPRPRVYPQPSGESHLQPRS